MQEDAKSANVVLEVKRLCVQGQLDRAIRLCKRSDVDPNALSKVFKDSMQRMLQRGRVNELLSLLFKNEGLRNLCPFTVSDLLQKVFDLHDFPGFLKQAYRFQKHTEFRQQIDISIRNLLDAGQVESASAYRLKFDHISGEQHGGLSTNHDRGSESSCKLCDSALSVLKRLDKGAIRIKRKHCCEFLVDGMVSASAYHNADGLKIYIHCGPDRVESLLEMAEYGQIRAIHRKNPDAIEKKRRPIVANALCKVDVELVMPLAAFAHPSQVSLGASAKNPNNETAAQQGNRHAQGVVPHLEGARRQSISTQVERNPRARAACIAAYGTRCTVCEIDFEVVYGILGRGFVHVHHLTPLSTTTDQGEVDPIQDLRPVCPNCHAMLHRRIPPYTISELRRILEISQRNAARSMDLTKR